jgi:hypothetical protein
MANVRETKRQRVLAHKKRDEEEAKKKNNQDNLLLDKAIKEAQKEEAAKKRADRAAARETSRPAYQLPAFLTRPRTVLDRSRRNKFRRDQRAAKKNNSSTKKALPPRPADGWEYHEMRLAKKLPSGEIIFGTVEEFVGKFYDDDDDLWNVTDLSSCTRVLIFLKA